MEYDKLGNLKSLIYPDDSIVYYTYDNMNRIKTVQDKDGINKYTYDKMGNRTRLDFANGTFEEYKYDKKGRTLSQVTSDKKKRTMTKHCYKYDNNDNIKYFCHPERVKRMLHVVEGSY